MAHITFYEKPGCANNARQRKLLETAGHTLDVRNLLTEAWSAATLQPFIRGRTVVEWFNRNAPRIKSGALDPQVLDTEAALQHLLAEPLLIKRPLLQWNEHWLQGFDVAYLQQQHILPVEAGAVPADIAREGCICKQACPPPTDATTQELSAS